jgi:hypothetical protein
LYNLVNDPSIYGDSDVVRLREMHVEVDDAAIAAYGYEDVDLRHGFHEFRKVERWTVNPAARVEILDRLLEENHRRAAFAPPSGRAERRPQIDHGPSALSD